MVLIYSIGKRNKVLLALRPNFQLVQCCMSMIKVIPIGENALHNSVYNLHYLHV